MLEPEELGRLFEEKFVSGTLKDELTAERVHDPDDFGLRVAAIAMEVSQYPTLSPWCSISSGYPHGVTEKYFQRVHERLAALKKSKKKSLPGGGFHLHMAADRPHREGFHIFVAVAGLTYPDNLMIAQWAAAFSANKITTGKPRQNFGLTPTRQP